MNRPRGLHLAAGVAAMLLASCATRRPGLVQAEGQDLIVLLPDADGTAGRVTVSNPSGAVDLATAGAAALVSATESPRVVNGSDAGDLNALFDDVLATLPPAPERFTLFFQFDSDELTEQSRALLPTIRQVVRKRQFAEVAVIGHTDTVGTTTGNLQLGLKRAEMARRLLIAAGLDASFVDATSHGEGDLLVHTPDGTSEARNRRVEISVR
jgi:outer membrane protein OmpA-like peptidoglycan-associated protein